MIRTLPLSSINVGARHRKDMGDVSALAASIEAVGLLQPIGVTSDLRLVFGDRRLRAIIDCAKTAAAYADRRAKGEGS